MAAKGFILLQEAVAICLLCVLCAAAGVTFSRCLRLQQQNLALQRALQTAENSLAGAERTDASAARRLLGTEMKFLEVQVGDGANKLTLVQALTAAETEGLADAGTAF